MSPEPTLERALVALAARIEFPPDPDLAPAVSERIRVLPSPRRWTWRPVVWTRRSVLLAAALVIVLGGIATGTYLGVRGVRIRYGPPPTPPASLTPGIGAKLDLGDRITLAQARGRVLFDPKVPAALGEPDEVYVDGRFPLGQLILLYKPRPGLPEARSTGEGLLLLEFKARLDRGALTGKFVEPSQIRPVRVGRAQGFWIEGAHTFGYLDASGNLIADTVRVAGNVLLWQVGEVTYRIESALPMADAIRIAESVG